MIDNAAGKDLSSIPVIRVEKGETYLLEVGRMIGDHSAKIALPLYTQNSSRFPTGQGYYFDPNQQLGYTVEGPDLRCITVYIGPAISPGQNPEEYMWNAQDDYPQIDFYYRQNRGEWLFKGAQVGIRGEYVWSKLYCSRISSWRGKCQSWEKG